MSKNLVMLYTKFPQIGNSKTRIAKESSERFAFGVSFCTLQDTINKLNNSSSYNLLVVVNTKEEAQLFKRKFNLNSYVLDKSLLQKNQSKRFTFLFSHFKQTYEKIILIPSDVPSVKQSTLIEAFRKLGKYRYVFGPEYNGGVYLIGMNDKPTNIFDIIRWSTEYSIKDLVSNSEGNSYLLKLKGDLNKLNDLKLFKDDIKRDSPLLYEFLSKNNFYKEVEMEDKIAYAYN